MEQAWLVASADQTPIIRSGHLLVALLTAADLYQIAIRASERFEDIPVELLKHKFLEECEHSPENIHHEDVNPVPAKASDTKQKRQHSIYTPSI